jgi:hypothetical protein
VGQIFALKEPKFLENFGKLCSLNVNSKRNAKILENFAKLLKPQK